MSPGCAGCQPSSARVSVLEAGLSAARKPARKPKCPLAWPAGTETTGTSRCRPITSAMARLGTPSSATACSRDPAGAFSWSQAEQVCHIEPVHYGPTAGAVADEARDSLVTGNADQGREESVIPVAVTRRGESHNRRTDA